MSKDNIDILTVDFNTNNVKADTLNKKVSSMASFPSGIGRQIIPWKHPHHRSPWDKIPDTHYKGMNFTFNINPDPDIEGYENTKKFLIPKVLLLLEKLMADKIINKYIIVYEWGKYGKKHGKLHFHGVIKTQKRDQFNEEVYKEFNKKTNCRHRTLTTKHFKDVGHRDTYLKYMKKETQNKIKCLMWR